MVAELVWCLHGRGGATSRTASRPPGDQLAFLENISRYSETRIDELRHSNDAAMTAVTQVLQASLTPSHTSAVQRSTFEVDTKLGKPTMLETSGANYEDFAFKFKTHVTQQDATLADELEKLEKLEKPEKPHAPPVPRSSLAPEMRVTCKVDNARIMKNIAPQKGLGEWRQLRVRHNLYTGRRATTKPTDILRWEFGGKALRMNRCQIRSSQQYFPSEHQQRSLNTFPQHRQARHPCENQAMGSLPPCEQEHGTKDVGALLKGKGKGKDNRKGSEGNKDKWQGKKGGRDKKGNGKTKGKGDETPPSTYFEGFCSRKWKNGVTRRKTAGNEKKGYQGTRRPRSKARERELPSTESASSTAPSSTATGQKGGHSGIASERIGPARGGYQARHLHSSNHPKASHP